MEIKQSLVKRSLDIEMTDVQEMLDTLSFRSACAQRMTVTNQISFEQAVNERDGFRELGKQAEAWRKAAVKPLNDEKDRIQETFKPFLNLIDETVRCLNKKIATYQQEEERKAREAQIKAEEEARKEREALIAEAEKSTSPEEAQALIERAELTAAPRIESTVATKAVQQRKKAVAIVTDRVALIKFIAANQCMASWIKKFDEKLIADYYKSTGYQVVVPGVEFKTEVSYAAAPSRKKTTPPVIEAKVVGE